jgi:hypothetical protein
MDDRSLEAPSSLSLILWNQSRHQKMLGATRNSQNRYNALWLQSMGMEPVPD